MIVRRAIDERKLDKIIIHPTLIPRLHADAFRKGEIRVGRLEDGFQIYEKTDKADSNVDYFPTGNMFLPPETRKALIELALAEAGLGQQGRGRVLSRDLQHQGLPGRDRRDQAPSSRRAAAHPARHGFRRHAGPPDQRRMRLDLSVAHPAPRQGFGDGDPAAAPRA